MDEFGPTGGTDPTRESWTTHFCPWCDSIVLSGGKRAYVDYEDRRRVGLRGWKAKLSRGGWYACKKIVHYGRTKHIYMHRLIMNTPQGMICHHGKGGTLDNRKQNLQNMTEAEHEQLHRHLRIARKNNILP